MRLQQENFFASNLDNKKSLIQYCDNWLSQYEESYQIMDRICSSSKGNRHSFRLVSSIRAVNDSESYQFSLNLTRSSGEVMLEGPCISIDAKKAVISFDSSILHTWFSEDDYVYILGANQGSLPPIVKDESYITDDCCKETYKEDSVCTNKMNREGTKQSLLRIPNLYISYTLSNDNGVCYPSALLQELPVQIVKPTWDWKHNYGGDYNKIKMASQLDQLRNYNEYTPSLTLLTSTYDVHDYLSYHHEFTPVANFHYHPVLSYTSLSSYMECAFKYYLTYILKLNEFEESFSQKVGNIYHYILSLWTKPKEELEAILQEQVKEASFYVLTLQVKNTKKKS